MRGRRIGLVLALIVLLLGAGSPQAVAMSGRAPTGAVPTVPAPPPTPPATPPPATAPTATPPAVPPATVGEPAAPTTAATAPGAPTTPPPTVATTAVPTTAPPTTTVAPTSIVTTIAVTTVAATSAPAPTTARSRLATLTADAGDEETNLTSSPWFWLAVVATPVGLALMAAAAFGWRTSPRSRRTPRRQQPAVRAVSTPGPPVVATVAEEAAAPEVPPTPEEPGEPEVDLVAEPAAAPAAEAPVDEPAAEAPVDEPAADEPFDEPAEEPVEAQAEEPLEPEADEPELVLTAPTPPTPAASVPVSTFRLTGTEPPRASSTATRHRIDNDSAPYGQRSVHGGAAGGRRHWTPRRIASVTGAAVIGVLYQRRGRFGR